MLKIREIGATTWTDLPTPDYNGGMSKQKYQIDASTSGRDSNGLMHRDRVAIKRKLNCTWSNRLASVINSIDLLTQSQFFELQFVDIDGTTYSGTFYCGDKEAPVYTESGNTIYGSFTLNFIER